MQYKLIIHLFIVLIICGCSSLEMEKKRGNTESVSISRIYGDGSSYCSFTSLVKSDGYYYLAFREGRTHVKEGDYGNIKILKSHDGENWSILQSISLNEVDLRDPCLSVLPNGSLLLLCGARYKTEDGYYTTKTYCAMERKGKFDELMPVIVPNDIDDNICCWIWKLTWNNYEGYGVAYRMNDNQSSQITLVKTTDGINYTKVTDIGLDGNPSEARLRFLEDGTMIALIRRDGGNRKGYIGFSNYPYIEWNLKELDIYLAGQDFIVDKEELICSTRIYENTDKRTCIWVGNLEGVFLWSYTLPSLGSETSYAGLLNEEKNYYISYCSMHEFEKPAIYLAKIPKSYLQYQGQFSSITQNQP